MNRSDLTSSSPATRAGLWANAQRLHREIIGSTLAIVAGAGHMVHHAAPDEVVAAIDRLETPNFEPAKQAA